MISCFLNLQVSVQHNQTFFEIATRHVVLAAREVAAHFLQISIGTSLLGGVIILITNAAMYFHSKLTCADAVQKMATRGNHELHYVYIIQAVIVVLVGEKKRIRANCSMCPRLIR
jgi:hypothetical protein